MEGKIIESIEPLKEVIVEARNYPTEKKPHAIRLNFTDGTYSVIEIDSRGNYGVFTSFLKVSYHA